MKTIKWGILSSMLLLPFYSLFGQLSKQHNHLRPGDVLIKQQVEFKDPGKAGNNLLWNFSSVKTVNDEYTLSYSLPPLEGDSVYIMADKRIRKDRVGEGELVVGTEHNTVYFYQLMNDSLLLLGHENPSVRLIYNQPMVNMIFPLDYGQEVRSSYNSDGLYSGTVSIRTDGEVTTIADAYGKLVLPSGDTLSPVLRVKTIQTILDNGDLGSNTKGKLLETYKWYSKGYRYPVFETVRSINLIDSTEIFTTAFYFPPQEHLYLDTDLENMALLDEMWDMENKKQDREQDSNDEIISIENIMSCKAYPNPVESMLHIDYELKEDAQVLFQLYSIDGVLVKSISKKQRKTGQYSEWMDCAGLQPRSYILRITANNAFSNQIIIKK